MECDCDHKIKYTSTAKNIIKSKYEMIEMQDAFSKIKTHFLNITNKNISNIIDKEIIEINSNYYISAENVYSPIDLPVANASMMDGYAVKSDLINLTAKEINVKKNIYAEKQLPEDKDKSNLIKNIDLDLTTQCVYVTTGSIIPSQFDCVIPIELVEQIEYNKKIKFIEDLTRPRLVEGSFIRKKGSDIHVNDIIIEKDKFINLIDVDILASVGIISVKVYKLPKIGIMSTGDELIDFHELEKKHPIGKSQNFVIDTNRLMLQKLIKEHYPNILITDYGIINDDIDNLQKTFDKVINDECDILISSGGVSMGEKDLVKKFLELKGEIIFGRLNMKPGKPTTFGSYKNITVCGLPGNPVSCIVCYYLIINFIIKTFQNPNLFTPTYYPYKSIYAKLLNDITLDTERPEYSRGILYLNNNENLENLFCVKTTGNQQSSRIKSFHDFNCLMCLPRGSEGKVNLQAGKDIIQCIMIKQFEVANMQELEEFKKIKSKSLIKSNEVAVGQINKNRENNKTFNKKYTVGTITISDRAFKGEYLKDESTEKLKIYFSPENDSNFILVDQKVVPDEKNEILNAYNYFVKRKINLIVTSGGTGLSIRDITPEVTREYIDKEATSISTYITMESMKITKFACLSRPVVGVKDESVIVTLPGNPKAIKENLDILKEILPHLINQVSSVKDFHN